MGMCSGAMFVSTPQRTTTSASASATGRRKSPAIFLPPGLYRSFSTSRCRNRKPGCARWTYLEHHQMNCSWESSPRYRTSGLSRARPMARRPRPHPTSTILVRSVSSTAFISVRAWATAESRKKSSSSYGGPHMFARRSWLGMTEPRWWIAGRVASAHHILRARGLHRLGTRVLATSRREVIVTAA